MTVLLDSELPRKIVGNYASDRVIHAGDPALDTDSHGIKDARGDGDLRLHDSEGFLYDEGSRYVPNEATGMAPASRINEDPFHDFTVNGLSVVDSLGGAVDAEIAKRHPSELVDDLDDDELGEAWLRQHDPTNPHYKKPGKARPRLIN